MRDDDRVTRSAMRPEEGSQEAADAAEVGAGVRDGEPLTAERKGNADVERRSRPVKKWLGIW